MKWLVGLAIVCGVLEAVYSQSSCVTPNGESAQCISFYKCKVFIDAYHTRTPLVVRFMRESSCGYKEDPLVCCGSVATYKQVAKPTPAPTTAATPVEHRNRNLLEPRKKCGIQGIQDRVFGGNMTGIDEFPWLALLEYRAKTGKNVGHSCGGVLINKKYVLTAAHCIVGRIQVELGNVFRVRLGEYDQNKPIDCVIFDEGGEKTEICADPHVDIDVEEAIAHPQYNDRSPSKYHDIGLIRLRQEAKYSEFIKPICLPLNNEETPVGKNVTVSGWGLTEAGIFSPIKLKADLPVVAEQQCASAFRPKNVQVARSQMCAGGGKGVDSCSGDSGSPLVSLFPGSGDFYVEGIVSFGAIACGTQGLPGIYTRVSEYLGWILDNMKP